jgi:hypothetical protein
MLFLNRMLLIQLEVVSRSTVNKAKLQRYPTVPAHDRAERVGRAIDRSHDLGARFERSTLDPHKISNLNAGERFDVFELHRFFMS